jgi:hypothetical protein
VRFLVGRKAIRRRRFRRAAVAHELRD